jgi:dipeptidyl aminopeptidase/acylaminoacyl peptidase
MIAYIGTQGGLPELYVVPAAGGTNTKVSGTLTGGSSGVSGMAWSPDGTRLAFVADADTAGLPELYVVGAGGGAVTKVSGTMVGGSTGVLDNFEGVPFRWAPAGDRLAFLATKDDASTTELYVVGPAGGAVTRVSGQVPIGDAVSEYAWSPDGSQLAFILFDAVNTGVNIDVFLANAGGGPTVASGVGNATKDVDLLLWSLGGELGFRVDRDGAGHYDLEVAAGINMSNLLDVVTPAAPFANTNYAVNASRTPPTWSPEGGRVAFLADADAANVFSLFVAVPRGVLLRLSDAPAARSVDNFAWSPLGFSR